MATLQLRIYLIWCWYTISVVLHSLAETTTCRQNNTQERIEIEGEFDNDAVCWQNLTTKAEGRSLKCVPMIKYFEVELSEYLNKGEGVGLTGDHQKLGSWQIDLSLEMKKRKRNSLKWYLNVPMCSALRIYYRFFIYYKDSKGFKRIRYWEGQQHARLVEAYEIFRHQGSQKFGQAHARAIGGGIQQERAWLRREYIIQLKFIWPQHLRFTSFTHFIRNPKYKLLLRVYGEKDAGYGADDTEIQVARFVNKKSGLKPLSEQGELYKPGSIVVFQITTSQHHTNIHILTIYTRDNELLGEVVIPASALIASEGILELPIYDKRDNYRVGWLTLPYLRIEAMPKALEFNLRASFHHYWPYNWPTLDIAHRGLGKSFYYDSANTIENTIGSYLMAHKYNSDMIEMDVQLTKDYVPIIWHDFGIYTTYLRNRQRLKLSDLEYEYINELTYEELLEKRVFIFKKRAMIEITHLNSLYIPAGERIFPKLQEVYENLPLTLGILLDIKWPQLMSSGKFESLQSLDKNKFVDVILEISMTYSCGRSLIMASFDADICSMIRYKQHLYPVIFQTMGQFSPWEMYADLRTKSFWNALNFVQSSDILGSAVYVGEFLDLSASNQDEFQMAFDLQQLLFIWGDQLNDFTILEKFRQQDVAGLIYDHLDDYLSQKPAWQRKRFGFFEAVELKRIFLRQCIAVGNNSIEEGSPDTHSPFWPRVRSFQ